ncbi:unnamed protein product, partial [Symbiodinium sp. KB8]
MSFSAMDIEAAFAVILAALEEGEDLAPFLQQFPPGSRRSLMLMLQASLPATRTAGKLQAMAGASTAGGGSGSNDGGVPAPAGPSMPEPNPEPPANVAAQAQPAPWPVPPPRKQPPTLPADGAPQATHLGQAKAKPPPVELWQSEGFRSEADARRSSAMGFVTAEAYYQSMAAPPVPPRAQPKQYKPSFPPVKPASQAPASSSADMAALQARIASEIAAGGSVLPPAPRTTSSGPWRLTIAAAASRSALTAKSGAWDGAVARARASRAPVTAGAADAYGRFSSGGVAPKTWRRTTTTFAILAGAFATPGITVSRATPPAGYFVIGEVYLFLAQRPP